ncbi:MAG: NAD(P)-binding protein [Nonomuraea sp.]|nr:NAD(P)-binding protein [Nonomuraea sp.]
MADLVTDVCVVGGGPAGLTLALLLVRSGVRVTVVERARSLERDYRGEILLPGGMAVLDRLGVLEPARERGSYEHGRFQVIERGRAVMDVDYRRLGGPYRCLLSVPQRHVLAELLARCERHDGFHYLAGRRATGLVREAGAVRGVVCAGATVRARCVVAADGRYSRIRRVAGIANRRQESFAQDVVWFRLPGAERAEPHVRIFRAGGNPVLMHRSHPDAIQVGWTLPHRGYLAVAEHGVDHVKDRIAAAIPPYADLVAHSVVRLADLTLLDVFAARAETWSADGLVLIGDAAHTLGPLGAQGLNLALQDAAVLHPILLHALRSGDVSAASLSRFERARGPDIDRAVRMQLLQSRLLLSNRRVGPLPRLASRLPRVTRMIAYGNPAVRVAAEHFTE